MRVLSLFGMILTFATTTVALGEGRVGNGGELVTDQHNPWFIGERPVTWCVEASDAVFSVSRDAIALSARLALHEWVDHWKAVILTPAVPNVLGGAKPNLTLQFEEQASCAADTELRFLFGVPDPEVDAASGFMSHYLVSLALRTQYDEATGRGKGLIWLAPDRGPHAYDGPKYRQEFWQDPEVVSRVLLHEIGHVFGLPHGDLGGDGDPMRADGPASNVSGGAHDGHLSVVPYSAVQWLRTGKEWCRSTKARNLATYLGFVEPDTLVRWKVCFKAASPDDRSPYITPIRISFEREDGVGGVHVLNPLPEPSVGGSWRDRSLVSGQYPLATGQLMAHDFFWYPEVTIRQLYQLDDGSRVHMLIDSAGTLVKLYVMREGKSDLTYFSTHIAQ